MDTKLPIISIFGFVLAMTSNSEDEECIQSGTDGPKIKVPRRKDRLRKDAEQYRENLAKRGVIYISRVPPFMKPNKARTMFEQYGEVTRLYLAEEDRKLREKRREKGGNASKQFQEGWVEFADKSIAKSVAESLNNTRIEAKKGSFYHDDLWNLKYLKNFKWEYLTEKISYERRVRESKLNLAMMHAKRTNAEVVELMEKTKVQKIVHERKRKRAVDATSNPSSSSNSGGAGSSGSSDNRGDNCREEMTKLAKKIRQVPMSSQTNRSFESQIDLALMRSAFKSQS